MLMLKGGHLAYLGPADAALSYFEGKGFSLAANENPADFFLDVLAGEVRDTANLNLASIPWLKHSCDQSSTTTQPGTRRSSFL